MLSMLLCPREAEQKRVKELKKLAAAEKRAALEAAKLEKGKIRPTDMFRLCKDYTMFDDRGVPTHDAGMF